MSRPNERRPQHKAGGERNDLGGSWSSLRLGPPCRCLNSGQCVHVDHDAPRLHEPADLGPRCTGADRPPMTRDEARALTDRIAGKVGDAMADIETAWRERVDELLGYASWGDYCRAEFQGLQLRPKDERPALVSSLAQTGMSNVAIADAVGVSEPTVRRQLRHLTKLPERSTGKDGKERPRRRQPAPIVDPQPITDPEAISEIGRILDRAPVAKWLAHGRQCAADLHRIADDLDTSAYTPLLPSEQQTLRVILDAITAARERWEGHAP